MLSLSKYLTYKRKIIDFLYLENFLDVKMHRLMLVSLSPNLGLAVLVN